jgi:hypothetical protein
MPDNDIVQAWRSFDDSRRTSLLAKMSPEQKTKLRSALESDTTVPPARAKTPPGFVSRFGQGVGIPTSKEEAKGMLPQTTQDKALAIANPAAYLAKGYVENVGREGKKAAGEIGEAIEQTGDIGPRIGKAAAATTEFVLRGMLGPVGGGAIQAWGEDINSNNYTGAAGSALAVLVNALMLHGSKPLADKPNILPATTKVDKLFAAGNLPESLHPAEVQAVLPDLANAAPTPPKTVGDLVKNVDAAKANINNEVGQAMFQLRGKKFSTQPIADAIKSHITPDMEMTKEGQQTAKALTKASNEYADRVWTGEQLHHRRIQANADLSSFYKKGSAAQYGDMNSKIGVIVDKEAGDAIRDIMYPEMDKAVGAPEGYYRGLLTRHGTLIEMGNAVKEQSTALAARTAKIRGGATAGENVSLYQSHIGAPGISAHKIQNIFKKPNPLAKANAQVSRAFSGRPVPSAIINSLPVRNLMLLPHSEPLPPNASAGDVMKNLKGKPPGQQKKDLRDIQQRYSNPNIPIGPEQ